MSMANITRTHSHVIIIKAYELLSNVCSWVAFHVLFHFLLLVFVFLLLTAIFIPLALCLARKLASNISTRNICNWISRKSQKNIQSIINFWFEHSKNNSIRFVVEWINCYVFDFDFVIDLTYDGQNKRSNKSTASKTDNSCINEREDPRSEFYWRWRSVALLVTIIVLFVRENKKYG